MSNEPVRDERILEALEACRPGSDDVADPALSHLADALETSPELEDLYQRVQRTDEVLAARFRDVATPEGLQQRLLDRLAAARTEQSVATDIAKAASTQATAQADDQFGRDDQPSVEPARSRRVSRRWLAAGLALTSAAAALVAVTIWQFQGPAPYTPRMVLRDAQQFYIHESPAPGRALTDPDNPPPTDLAFSRDVRKLRSIQWRAIEGLLGRDGVAYDMPGGGATLYVVRMTVDDMPVQPPLQPGLTTGGYCTAAWQDGDRLYVLVVAGKPDSYRDYLAPVGPWT